ncbi:MAG TPA: DNA gyrase subunit A [Erysipelothrix sp.]|nr:DNA gyrase subunit A [Erysipelothrix sp.]
MSEEKFELYEEEEDIRNPEIDISREMKKSFLDYSMSVIVSRALPDVRDGMKPVHRRILYAMNQLNMYSDRPTRKSAWLVGEVMGKYHPHGDAAIYSSMVRMAQNFSYRYPLVQGQGNFGSIDGDGAAHMRYTEARMSKISMEMLRDINRDTVDFINNYDDSIQEPSVLPSRIPNLLINGAMGIAVGMATNIPPHNLNETINATIAMIDDPQLTTLELMNDYIFGPDFPTGSQIVGRAGIRKAFETGRGSIVQRAKIRIEEMGGGKKRLIVYEIPYQVNKSKLIERIADLVREKQIEGITDLRDESNRKGIRIVIELRRDTQEDVLINQLYRMTPLQSNFGVNMVALVNGEPKLLSLREMIQHYIDFQIEVTTRKLRFDLERAENRAHLLDGFFIALDNIDEVIKIIRHSQNDQEASNNLAERFNLSAVQIKAILDMPLRRLTGLERERLRVEYEDLIKTITELKDILDSHPRLMQVIKDDLTAMKEKYGDERRSEIIEGSIDVMDEDLIPVEDIVIELTNNGYIKSTTIDTYQVQNRGGRGIRSMNVHEDDVIEQMITMSTHDDLLAFTNSGKVYRIKGYQVPFASRVSKGIPIVNLIDLDENEQVRALLKIKPDDIGQFATFVTRKGLIKRTEISEFKSIRVNGKIAIKLAEDDELVAVRETTGNDEILIASNEGRAVRFHETNVRPSGRNAMGVRGLNVGDGYVVGMTTNHAGTFILSVSENGYGKKTSIEDYRITNRGGKGVITMKINERNGQLVAFKAVEGDEDALIVTDVGTLIRLNLSQVGIYGRNTQGVRLIKVGEQKVSSIAIIDIEEEEKEEREGENDQN